MDGITWTTFFFWVGGLAVVYGVLQILALRWRNQRLEANNRKLRSEIYGNHIGKDSSGNHEDTEEKRCEKAS